MTSRTPSAKWSEVGAPRKYRPCRPSAEQWTIGFGLGYGAVVVDAVIGWDWRISDGAGEIVRSGSALSRDEAMIEAEDDGAELIAAGVPR